MDNLIITPSSKNPPSKGLFRLAQKKYGVSGVAKRLGLHDNTIKRWILTGKVPEDYYYDFARILGKKTKPAVGIDQFYTKPEVANKCWEKFENVMESLNIPLKNYQFIEPSAGCGWFYNLMPQKKRIGIDIAPNLTNALGKELITADFLTWHPDKKYKYIVVGNPPFGLRGHLALQFINHAAKFADVVAFILPQLFESDGKGVPAKRVKELKLAFSESLPPNSFIYPDGKEAAIWTVFQVWTKVNWQNIRRRPASTCRDYIKVFSLSDGGTPASTRNKKMIDKCDVYLPSTCYSGMRAYKIFDNLPHRRGYGVVIHQQKKKIKPLLLKHDWTKSAYPSTNSALNLRSSKIAEVVIQTGFIDKNTKTL